MNKELNKIFESLFKSKRVDEIVYDLFYAYFLKAKRRMHRDFENNEGVYVPCGRYAKFHKGSLYSDTHFLRPSNDIIVDYYATEIEHALISIYNDNYWLIALWLCLYDELNNSRLTREISRAFIIHCICVTSENVARCATEDVFPNDLHNYCSLSKEQYYKKIFSVSSIFKKMRQPYRVVINNRKLTYGDFNEFAYILSKTEKYHSLLESIDRLPTPRANEDMILRLDWQSSLGRFFGGLLRTSKTDNMNLELKKLLKEYAKEKKNNGSK